MGNIFKDWEELNLFCFRILDKIADDWVKSRIMPFTKENFEKYILTDFLTALEEEMEEFCETEFER